MVDNVVGIGEAPKETFKVFNLRITFMDGETQKIACSFFGSSMDNPLFMVFTKGPLDPEDATYPSLFINSDVIKTIEVLNIKEVEV